ncbi:cyclopropane-fatty-acyl-phospholipid synthase family protein [Frankia sp. AiPs1]|uniref:SAM-dependent methyltransferase n=1 Tax=Frankia sp. AiPs1 TaxID=573493 RepID=UPI0020433FE9|nr:cyclopropane-fatty-acyl-phospholipid synthase family protein [Frankia sp. AiPs1]MCM3923479.1 cyclopropane-fatty-acyl-phospholipid synthase family protein [Frankia sp. AiPs1]
MTISRELEEHEPAAQPPYVPDPRWSPELARATRTLLETFIGTAPPVRIVLWDGSALGPDTPTQVVVRSPEAMRRALFRPGELGFARAYVAGDLDVEGDIFAALELRNHLSAIPHRPTPATAPALLTLLGGLGARPPAPPPEEARLHGRRHSRHRDAAAISHHYDVSNAFYRLLLGPTMTYSCGVWESPASGLDAAQTAKHELVCRKLGLRPGERLLDVGCGWGSMLIHAARHHGVRGVGVTISVEQAAEARRRIAEAGLTDAIEIRLQDYREIPDGPFDAISSVGMVEHVGRAMLPTYFASLYRLLRPGGRLLNHGISSPGDPAGAYRYQPHLGPIPLPKGRDFLRRYVFPDGELHEIGLMTTLTQAAGFEVRHVENLREHYALTLRAWVRALEENWDAAVGQVGAGRARVWRLYMAGSALSFETGQTQIHQTLAVRPDAGRSGQPLRPRYDSPAPLPTQPTTG